MTVVEALPMDIQEALYHYCRDDESLNDSLIRALRTELFRWHDIRKDPKDLPEPHTVVLNQDGIQVMYDYNKDVWRIDDADYHICDSPIAWCVVPTFNT